jgi:hypothetical protein
MASSLPGWSGLPARSRPRIVIGSSSSFTFIWTSCGFAHRGSASATSTASRRPGQPSRWAAFEESILRRIEAAIAWPERPRIERTSAKARIYYLSPGVIIIAGDGEPVSAELSHLPAVIIA